MIPLHGQARENLVPSLFLGDVVSTHHVAPLNREGINFLFYKENKEKNVVILLINREAVQLATLELYPLNIKLGLL